MTEFSPEVEVAEKPFLHYIKLNRSQFKIHLVRVYARALGSSGNCVEMRSHQRYILIGIIKQFPASLVASLSPAPHSLYYVFMYLYLWL